MSDDEFEDEPELDDEDLDEEEVLVDDFDEDDEILDEEIDEGLEEDLDTTLAAEALEEADAGTPVEEDEEDDVVDLD